MKTFHITTTQREEMIDISNLLRKHVNEVKVDAGTLHVFVPHTTAAITINENADPDVASDMLNGMARIVPDEGYRHLEGNSPAHIKSSMFGVSLCVNIVEGRLLLGSWQGIYFCEFDGPRERKCYVNVL